MSIFYFVYFLVEFIFDIGIFDIDIEFRVFCMLESVLLLSYIFYFIFIVKLF